MMNQTKLLIPCLLFLLMSSAVSSDNTCIKGDIKYSVVDYKEEFEPHYARLFKSMFAKPLLHFLCNQEIKNLPIHPKKKRGQESPSQHHIIEPLFVDLSTFDGIYAKRIYSLEPQARNPRFTCGFFHYVFIFSNNEYIELTGDSLLNEKIIQTKLSHRFTEQERQQMKAYYKDDVLCDHLSFLSPVYVKKSDSILFDASKE